MPHKARVSSRTYTYLKVPASRMTFQEHDCYNYSLGTAGINESLLVALERHDSEHASVDIGSIFSEIVRFLEPRRLMLAN